MFTGAYHDSNGSWHIFFAYHRFQRKKWSMLVLVPTVFMQYRLWGEGEGPRWTNGHVVFLSIICFHSLPAVDIVCTYYTTLGMTMATLPPGSSPLVRLMIVPLSAITHPKFALNATHRDFLLEQQAAFASADPAHDDLWVAAKMLQVRLRSLACRRRLHAYHEPLLCEQVTLSETRTWPLFFYPSVPIESSNVLLFSADQNEAGRTLFLQRYGDLSPSAMVQVSLCAAAPGFLNDATLQPVLKKQCKGFPLPRVESSDGPVQLPFPIGGPSMAGIDATDQIDITPENFAHYGPLFCDDGNLDCTLRCRPCPLC